jgi:hypothetical protein
MPEEGLEPLGRALAIRLVEVAGEGPATEGLIRSAQRQLRLVKGIRVGGVAFLLAIITQAGDSGPVLAGFLHDGESWQLEDLSIVRSVPGIGSNGFTLVVATAGGLVAVGGFVDPSVSRLSVVDPFGTVVDADDPLAGGAILVSGRFGLVQVRRGDLVIGAEPVTIAATEEELEQLRPDRLDEGTVDAARQAADAFVAAFLSRGWVPAAEHFNPRGRPDLLLPALAEVVPPAEWEVAGPPRETGQGFVYPIEGPDGKARLGVQVNQWLGDWKVVRILFSTPPGGAAPIG